MYDYWNEDYIEHHGIKGQKWGIRRYQYDDGSLTPEGRKRYLKGDGSLTRAGKKELSRRQKIARYGIGTQLNRAYKGENVTLDETKIPEDLKDNSWKKYEQQYTQDTKSYNVKSFLAGEILGAGMSTDYLNSLGFGEAYDNFVKTSGSPKEAVDSFCKKYKINTTVKVGDILDKKVSNDDATTNAKNDGTKNIYKPIKNIPTGVDNIFGLMETGLNQKDGKRYAQLWNKFQNNPKVANMDVWDLGLNVDGDDPYYGRQLAKDVEEFSALHNKAYHNVYG